MVCSSFAGVFLTTPFVLVTIPFFWYFCKEVLCGADYKGCGGLKLLSTIAGIFYVLGGIFMCIATYVDCIGNDIDSSNRLEELGIFYIFGVLMLQFIYILRLKNAFVDSPLSPFVLSPKTFKILCTMYGISVAAMFLVVLFYFVNLELLMTTFMVVFTLCYFGNYILLLRLFWFKNKQMLEAKKDAVLNSNNDSNDNNNNNSNDKSLIVTVDTINTFIRYTVSCYVGFFTSIITWVLLTIDFILRGYLKYDSSGVTWGEALSGVDCAINFICICLLFKFDFSNKFYDNYCKCCINCIKSRIGFDLQS